MTTMTANRDEILLVVQLGDATDTYLYEMKTTDTVHDPSSQLERTLLSPSYDRH